MLRSASPSMTRSCAVPGSTTSWSATTALLVNDGSDTAWEPLPAVEAEALEVVMRQVLESGTTIVPRCRAWSSTRPAREHAFSASFFCLQDADGTALSVCAMSVDVTGNRRARERLAILSEAGTRIGSTLEVMRTGQELADLAVPLLADHAVVDLMESVPFGVDPSAGTRKANGRPPVLRRAGVASIDPGVLELPWVRQEVIRPFPTSLFATALRTGRSYLESVLDTSSAPRSVTTLCGRRSSVTAASTL